MHTDSNNRLRILADCTFTFHFHQLWSFIVRGKWLETTWLLVGAQPTDLQSYCVPLSNNHQQNVRHMQHYARCIKVIIYCILIIYIVHLQAWEINGRWHIHLLGLYALLF